MIDQIFVRRRPTSFDIKDIVTGEKTGDSGINARNDRTIMIDTDKEDLDHAFHATLRPAKYRISYAVITATTFRAFEESEWKEKCEYKYLKPNHT